MPWGYPRPDLLGKDNYAPQGLRPQLPEVNGLAHGRAQGSVHTRVYTCTMLQELIALVSRLTQWVPCVQTVHGAWTCVTVYTVRGRVHRVCARWDDPTAETETIG